MDTHPPEDDCSRLREEILRLEAEVEHWKKRYHDYQVEMAWIVHDAAFYWKGIRPPKRKTPDETSGVSKVT